MAEQLRNNWNEVEKSITIGQWHYNLIPAFALLLTVIVAYYF